MRTTVAGLRSVLIGVGTSALLSFTGCQAGEGATADVYVSPQGHDDAIGGADTPLRTLDAARAKVRVLKKDHAGTIRVKLMPGRYVLTKTFVLGLEDGGTGTQHIVYEAAQPDQPPVICSDVSVSGWQKAGDVPHSSPKAQGYLWVADLPQGLSRIYSLYDGDRALPNSSHAFDSTSPVSVKGGTTFRRELSDKLYCPEGLLRDYENLSDMEVSIYPRQRWMHAILSIKEIKADENLAVMTRKLDCGLTQCPGRKQAVRLLNTIDYLDEPGEWCVNTLTRKIYYWPVEGTPSENINAPALREFIRVEGAIDLEGPKDTPVRNIHFRNLAFIKGERDVIKAEDGLAHSEWATYDADNAVLRFRGAESCSADGLTITNSAGCGVRMDLHAQKITLANSTIHDIGKSAVVVLGYGPGTKNVNGFNKVINCTIYNTGLIHRLGHGVLMAQTHDSVVSNCRIYDTPMNAISIVGMRYWVEPDCGRHGEYRPVRYHELPQALQDRILKQSLRFDAEAQSMWYGISPHGFTDEDMKRKQVKTDWFDYEAYIHTRNNTVQYCDISQASQDLGDSNAVYIHTSNEGNKVYYNYIHDMTNNHASTVIRTDNVQRQAVFSHNIIANATCQGAINVSYDTEVTNNYLVNMSGLYIFLHQGPWPNTSRIERNIIYDTVGAANLAIGILKNKANASHELEKLKTVRSDYNLFFSERYSDEQAKAVGKNEYSVLGAHSRYADPGFEDLKTFKLKPDSPAASMGIEQLDVSKMGLLETAYRIDF